MGAGADEFQDLEEVRAHPWQIVVRQWIWANAFAQAPHDPSDCKVRS